MNTRASIIWVETFIIQPFTAGNSQESLLSRNFGFLLILFVTFEHKKGKNFLWIKLLSRFFLLAIHKCHMWLLWKMKFNRNDKEWNILWRNHFKDGVFPGFATPFSFKECRVNVMWNKSSYFTVYAFYIDLNNFLTN